MLDPNRRRHLSAVADHPTAAAPDGRTHELRSVRCECRSCGVHVVVRMCFTVAGSCPNCGSYDLAVVVPPSLR